MSAIEQSVDVEIPVEDAYRQWSQLRSFPRFMQGVRRIDQISDTRSRWSTDIGGIRREFVAEITEDVPGERVAWRSVSGPAMRGVVKFEELGPRHTRVEVNLDFTPNGFAETAADRLGLISHRVRNDLERFKDYTEEHGPRTRVRAVEPAHHEQHGHPTGAREPAGRPGPDRGPHQRPAGGMSGRADLGGPPMGRRQGPEASPLEPPSSRRARAERQPAEPGRTGRTPRGDGTGRQPGPEQRMGERATSEQGTGEPTVGERRTGEPAVPGGRTGERRTDAGGPGLPADAHWREPSRRIVRGEPVRDDRMREPAGDLTRGSARDRPAPGEQRGEPVRDRAGEGPPSGEEPR